MSRYIKRENVHVGTSLFTNRIGSDLITPTESYGRFEPGGVLDIAILAQSSAWPPKCILPLRNGVV